MTLPDTMSERVEFSALINDELDTVSSSPQLALTTALQKHIPYDVRLSSCKFYRMRNPVPVGDPLELDVTPLVKACAVNDNRILIHPAKVRVGDLAPKLSINHVYLVVDIPSSPRLTKTLDATRPLSPPRRPVQAPPSHPDRQKPVPVTSAASDTNPFTRRSLEHTAAPVPPADPDPVSVSTQRRPSKISQNPFLARDRLDSGVDGSAPPVNVSSPGKLPPLPPRKPAVLAALPNRPSEAVPTPSTSTIVRTAPPLIPTKPTHVMSSLMRQSLEASKHAQSLKRAEEQLEQERVLQVLKTTSSSSSGSNTTPSTRTRSLSPAHQLQKRPKGNGTGSGGSDDATCVPPLPRRRNPSLGSSRSSSVLSLEQVANATLPSPITAPSRPPLPSRDMIVYSTSTTDGSGLSGLGPIRPPTHPRRRASTSTEPTNDVPAPVTSYSPSHVVRSDSVASSSSTTVPPPPPRRKRLESVQLAHASDAGDLVSTHSPPALAPSSMHARTHGRATSYQGGLSRHLSLTRGREHESLMDGSSPIANIQKTLTHLQLKAQPKLDAVRYKAEAGISRRGYVHHSQLGAIRWREEGEEGLMTDTRWAAANVDRDPDSEPTTDEEPSSVDDHGARTTSTGSYRDLLTESDNLKWPMGEGWKPL